MSSEIKTNVTPNLHNDLNNMIKVYLENLHVLPSDESLEFEVRFGTRNIKTITKIDYDNVVQMLLNYGFIFDNNEIYRLRIQNEYIEKTSRLNKISNLRTEINGLSNIQQYCRTNGLPENPHQAGIIFNQTKYFNKGQTLKVQATSSVATSLNTDGAQNHFSIARI